MPIVIGVGAFLLSLVIALYSFQRVKLVAALREKSELRQHTIKDRIMEPGWRLNYNPKFSNKSKPISFSEDGTIGEGRNINEYKWHLNGDMLEILREDGRIHNRFKYDSETDRFVAVQPSAVHGIVGQFIYRDF